MQFWPGVFIQNYLGGIEMKKIILSLLIFAVVIGCVACGKAPQSATPPAAGSAASPQQGSQSSPESEPAKTANKGGLMEELLAHETTPESDFSCRENNDGGVTLIKYKGDDNIVVIPETHNGKPITAIGKFTFGVSSDVKAIKLADSITTLTEFAFAQNEALQIVLCGSGLETIEGSVFQGCKALEEISLNDGLKSMGQMCLASCSSLKEVVIPDSVVTIEGATCYIMSDDFVIKGSAGSAAETYAAAEDFTFEAQ